jgi:hypothetical protein
MDHLSYQTLSSTITTPFEEQIGTFFHKQFDDLKLTKLTGLIPIMTGLSSKDIKWFIKNTAFKMGTMFQCCF